MKKLWLGAVVSMAMLALPVACGSSNVTKKDGGAGGGTATGGGTSGTGGGTSATGGGSTATGGGTSGTGGGSSATGGGISGTGGGSSATGGGDTGTGGGSSGTGGGISGTGGGSTDLCFDQTMCSTLVPGGAYVTPMYSSATPPTPSGGTLVPGTYNLIAVTLYVADGGTGTAGEARRSTLVSNYPDLSLVDEAMESDGGCTYVRQVGTTVGSGTNITFTPSCPACTNCGGSIEYSVNGNELTLFEGSGPGLRTQTFTKQ